MLTPTIVAVTKDYQEQRRLKQLPTFSKDKTHGVQGRLSNDIW